MKVVVALSGGVDSSVTAALLQEQGHEVEGIFMKNWSPLDSQSLTDCPWEEDQADAEAVCCHLGIPFRSINFEREYRQKVVDYLVNEYAAGRTPNPDVLCNKEIKFDAFKKVAESLGAEAIATGHYATVKDGKLYRGKDNGKDQSYFLYTLDGSQLENVMMPLGQMVKSEVRKEAVRFGLPTASKKDSQGICFIGHLNLKDFLEGEIGSSPGEVRLLGEDVSEAERIGSSQRVGEHKGSAFYTVGEKMGPYIDNRLFSKVTGINQIPPLFLAHKDAQTNVVYVTPNREDSFLLRRIFKLEKAVLTGSRNETSLVDTIAILRSKTLEAQVRYQQDPVSVKEVFEEDGSIMIELSKPVWGAATGQSLVLFSENNVVGGGVVCATR